MAKLVAHEVQIASVDGSCSDKAYHLVKGNTPVSHKVLVALLEVPIHVGVNESEHYCLVAHESLVMAFAVADGLFVSTAVFHLPEY